MKAVVIILGLCAVTAMSGCNRRAPVLFDGRAFKASVDATSEDRRAFTVLVRDAAAMPQPARRAARYEAVQYCLKRFGGSAITWADDQDADPKLLLTVDGALVRNGRCDFR